MVSDQRQFASGGSALLRWLFWEAIRMLIPEARNYVNRDCSITYRDRHGDLHTRTTRVHDVTFVPMYGACFVGDTDDIWLDRVTSINALS
jgi:hypothetical protein